MCSGDTNMYDVHSVRSDSFPLDVLIVKDTWRVHDICQFIMMFRRYTYLINSNLDISTLRLLTLLYIMNVVVPRSKTTYNM